MAIEPVDRKRCQVDVPNGNSFMTLGGRPGTVRCPNVPVFVVEEKVADAEGHFGHMSMCARCSLVFREQMGQAAEDDYKWEPICLPIK